MGILDKISGVRGWVASFGILWVSVLMCAKVSAAELKIGERFPSLVLPRAADGEPDSLQAYRGTKTVLHVFASW